MGMAPAYHVRKHTVPQGFAALLTHWSGFGAVAFVPSQSQRISNKEIIPEILQREKYS
jgi:hypothetical protein